MNKINFNDRYGLTQAVIEGRKTMTRRVVKINSSSPVKVRLFAGYIQIVNEEGYTCGEKKLPYKVGEIVAVAQSYRNAGIGFVPNRYDGSKWGNPERMGGWNSKMFVRADLMPHRIRITGIRCERLQDISDDDCIREGINKVKYCDASGIWRRYYFHFGVTPTNCAGGQYKEYPTPREAFASLIDKVSGRGTWVRNPWVVVYEFELVK